MRPLFIPVLALLGLTACEVGPDYHLPAEAKINDGSAQGTFVSIEPATASPAAVPDGWWHLYDDALLDHLEKEALAANTDLRIAAANLARAQALQDAAEGEHEIKAGAEFTAERAQLSGQSFLLPVQMPSQYLGNGGIRVSYQLDLFGRLQRATEAASADREASAAGLELAEITVAAEVARSYAEACAANNERQVAERNLTLQQRTQSVTEQLVDAGRESTTAVTRAQAQVASAGGHSPVPSAAKAGAVSIGDSDRPSSGGLSTVGRSLCPAAETHPTLAGGGWGRNAETQARHPSGRTQSGCCDRAHRRRHRRALSRYFFWCFRRDDWRN